MSKKIEPQYMGITAKMRKLICKLQDINKKAEPDQEKINKIGREILRNNLIAECENKHFAKQLLIKNNVDEKYFN